MDTEKLQRKSWWSYLDKIQQDLIKQSLDLVEEEEKRPKFYKDYSFVVFPAAKAYEGFLKKLFFDLGLITRTQFAGERFRIGRALNPAIYKEYPQESVYEKLTRFCGGEEVSAKLWKTWKNSRNLIFHFFSERENLVSLSEAKKRVKEIFEAIDFSFKECQVQKETLFFRKKTFRYCLFVYLLVLIFWTFFRIFFSFPLLIEEGIFKPLFWIFPLVILVKYVEKRSFFPSLGFSGKNFENSLLVVFGLIFFFLIEGLIFGIFRFKEDFLTTIYFLPIGSFSPIFVYLITALAEETFFRGFLFNRLWEVLGNPWRANFLVSLGFLLIHLPISIFVFQLTLNQIFLSFLLLLVMSLGSGWLFSLTYNIIPSILWHFLWNWQVILGV